MSTVHSVVVVVVQNVFFSYRRPQEMTTCTLSFSGNSTCCGRKQRAVQLLLSAHPNGDTTMHSGFLRLPSHSQRFTGARCRSAII